MQFLMVKKNHEILVQFWYQSWIAIVNVEKLKLYESPMIVEQDVQVQAPSLDEFSPKYLNKLQEDVILDKKDGSSWRGDM